MVSASRVPPCVPIAVAPNGGRRTKADHPALPIGPVELARTAAECLEAGAAMIHVHVRDSADKHLLDADAYKAVIKAVRAEVGERMVVQITSEALGIYGPEEQMAVVRIVKPQAASLALREILPEVADEAAFADFLLWMRAERVARDRAFRGAAGALRARTLHDGSDLDAGRPSALSGPRPAGLPSLHGMRLWPTRGRLHDCGRVLGRRTESRLREQPDITLRRNGRVECRPRRCGAFRAENRGDHGHARRGAGAGLVESVRPFDTHGYSVRIRAPLFEEEADPDVKLQAGMLLKRKGLETRSMPMPGMEYSFQLRLLLV
jgi:hypothetical protein